LNRFAILLHDANRLERIDDVVSFVGEDASGSFGIRAHHGRMMTTLTFGLARFRIADSDWEYLALPGALFYFNNNELTLTTRRYLRDRDYTRISTALKQELLAEEENLKTIKHSLHRMEEELLKRMWKLGRHNA